VQDLPPPPPPGNFPPPPPPPGGYPVESVPEYQSPYASPFARTRQVGYGGFWIRFVAYLIDYVIVAIPSWILLSFSSAITGVDLFRPTNLAGSDISAAALLIILATQLIVLIWDVGYFVYFWSSGGTLGMRFFHLRVVDAVTNRPIGIWRALLRYIGFVLAFLPCAIGLIWAAFDGYKQGWHDKIANTLVLQG
jgi:uncharacterized RDD family membrane protein YckC